LWLSRAAAASVGARLQAAQGTFTGVRGLNVGKNKESADAARDYAQVTAQCGPFVDFVTINVSSPNTPGLRTLQSPDALAEIIDAVRQELPASVPPAVLVKVAPDLAPEDIDGVLSCASAVDGFVISNTTIDRPKSLTSRHHDQTGGLSGAPVFQKSTDLLNRFYAATGGNTPLIGVGGIDDATTAYAKIRAGASLVQLYSALVFKGPALVGQILQGLLDLIARDGFKDIESAIGADHKMVRP